MVVQRVLVLQVGSKDIRTARSSGHDLLVIVARGDDHLSPRAVNQRRAAPHRGARPAAGLAAVFGSGVVAPFDRAGRGVEGDDASPEGAARVIGGCCIVCVCVFVRVCVQGGCDVGWVRGSVEGLSWQTVCSAAPGTACIFPTHSYYWYHYHSTTHQLPRFPQGC